MLRSVADIHSDTALRTPPRTGRGCSQMALNQAGRHRTLGACLYAFGVPALKGRRGSAAASSGAEGKGGGSGRRTKRLPLIDASAGNCAVWSASLSSICAPRRRRTHPSPHPRPPAVSERDTQRTHTPTGPGVETACACVGQGEPEHTHGRVQAANADEARYLSRTSVTNMGIE